MNGVEIRGLSKFYGLVEVIHNLDLTIHEGEFVALVGPSGCGKSTLLRVIAGLEEATSGDVSIGGIVVNDVNPRDRNIAMVFQSYALYPHMTVAENMGFSLKLARRPKAEARAMIEKAAATLDLTDYLDRRPAQLSGGQRQRVAMGRALVRDPSVFLFDEPLSNLDAKLRVQMRMEIKALHQAVRKTSVYVTHDQIEAMTLADRIVVLNKGKIEQQGTPLDLYSRPGNLFVAGFIGSPTMNLLTATAHVGAVGVEAVLGDGTRLALPQGLALTEGQSITLGIRPQHLSRNGVGEQLAGTTFLVEPTGSETHVTFRVGEETVTAAVSGEEIIGAGEPFSANVPAAYIHVFDSSTTQRVQAA